MPAIRSSATRCTAGGSRFRRGATPALAEALRGFRRQALHAAKLKFPHPRDGRSIEVEAKLPADFLALIAALKRDRNAAEG